MDLDDLLLEYLRTKLASSRGERAAATFDEKPVEEKTPDEGELAMLEASLSEDEDEE
jgi:hypothetical protein